MQDEAQPTLADMRIENRVVQLPGNGMVLKSANIFMRIVEPDGRITETVSVVPWEVPDTAHEKAQQWQHYLRRRHQQQPETTP
jgi:hypothetical protein